MILLEALRNIFLVPLELVFEVIFTIALKITHSEGLAIIMLSLAINTLVLPLYKRADELQAEERRVQAKMADRIKRIKKTFKGDERFFMLQEYYRINNYKPIYALKSSASLLLQIPFFAAAYDFLGVRASGRLSGVGFLFFDNLGAPDGLISLGSFNINALPFLMTLVNILAGYIYTKYANDISNKTAMRTYILALVFLVLLYNCSTALLIYWTMNNVYSLAKSIIMNNSKVHGSEKAFPSGFPRHFFKFGNSMRSLSARDNNSLFFMSLLFMSVITGLLIPLAYLSASPEEFISVADPQNPLHYLLSSFFVSIGFFVFWPSVFYYLADKRKRFFFSVLMLCFSACSAVNYLLFGKDTGTISTSLIFEKGLSYTLSNKLLNLLAIIAVSAACIFLCKYKKSLTIVLVVSIMAFLTISVIDAKKVQDTYVSVMGRFDDYSKENAPKITLSADGKNVVVIMLDRASSGYIPYAFNENPELIEQYDGFVYYPNTMSFGQNTLTASSALFGGYEYTPERMDARADETLAAKHDEALKVMPKVLSNYGYNTTLMDIPFPGWSWTKDYSTFKEIDNCEYYFPKDYYSSGTESNINMENRRNRNLFIYSIFRCSPLCLQEFIYDNGAYLSVDTEEYDKYDFMENYKVLENLSNMTELSNSYSGSLFLIDNEATHDVSNIRGPELSNYRFEEGYYISDGENELYLWSKYQAACYECLVASLKELGNYLDYLREIGVYDNTRIIIVSDHATFLNLFMDLKADDFDAEWYNCLLLVKDFDSTGFSTDNEFMCNADVPTIAFKGIVDNPINPYTGRPIDSKQKYEDIYVNYASYYSNEILWNPDYNKGNTFNYADDCVWYKLINRNIFVHDNWVPVDKPG